MDGHGGLDKKNISLIVESKFVKLYFYFKSSWHIIFSTPNLLSSGQVSRLKLIWEQTEVNKKWANQFFLDLSGHRKVLFF